MLFSAPLAAQSRMIIYLTRKLTDRSPRPNFTRTPCTRSILSLGYLSTDKYSTNAVTPASLVRPHLSRSEPTHSHHHYLLLIRRNLNLYLMSTLCRWGTTEAVEKMLVYVTIAGVTFEVDHREYQLSNVMPMKITPLRRDLAVQVRPPQRHSYKTG